MSGLRRLGFSPTEVRGLVEHGDLRRVGGLHVSSVPRLLIELAAAGAAEHELGVLIEAAIRRNRLDIADLAATLGRNRGRPGVARVKALCDEYLPRRSRKSGLERSFDRWLRGHPEIPEPQCNVRLGPWEIDCYWPVAGARRQSPERRG